MNRTGRFLSRFIIALWFILVSAFVCLLISESPSLPNTPFAGISIDAGQNLIVQLPNRIFTCIETEQQFQCSAILQNRLLELTWTKGGAYPYNLQNCQALYAGRQVSCLQTGGEYIRGLLFQYTLASDLGLSQPQLQELQQQYWGINTLMRSRELHVLRISTGLAIAAGISATFFAWQHPGRGTKAFASFICGFGVFGLTQQLLGFIPYDALIPYELTIQTWNWLVNGVATLAGIGAGLAVATRLWLHCDRRSQIVIGVSSSAGLFSVCWMALTLLYFGAGIINNIAVETALRWFFAAISLVVAIVAAVLLYVRSEQTTKAFVCLSSGIGALALACILFLHSLLGLGYVD